MNLPNQSTKNADEYAVPTGSAGVDCLDEEIVDLSAEESQEIEGIVAFYDPDDTSVEDSGEPGLDELLDGFINAFDSAEFGPELSAEGDLLGDSGEQQSVSSVPLPAKVSENPRDSYSNVVLLGNSAPPANSLDQLLKEYGSEYFAKSDFSFIQNRASDAYGSRVSVVTYPTDAPSIMRVTELNISTTSDVRTPYVTIDLLLADAILVGMNITLKSRTAIRQQEGLAEFLGKTAQFIEAVIPKFPNYDELEDYGLTARKLAWDLVNVGDIHKFMKKKARSPTKPSEIRVSNIDLAEQKAEKDNPVYMLEFHGGAYDRSPAMTLNTGVRRVMELQPAMVLGPEGLSSCVGLMKDQNGYPRVFQFYAPDSVEEKHTFLKTPDGHRFPYSGSGFTRAPAASPTPSPIVDDDGLKIQVNHEGRYEYSTPAPARHKRRRKRRM